MRNCPLTGENKHGQHAIGWVTVVLRSVSKIKAQTNDLLWTESCCDHYMFAFFPRPHHRTRCVIWLHQNISRALSLDPAPAEAKNTRNLRNVRWHLLRKTLWYIIGRIFFSQARGAVECSGQVSAVAGGEARPGYKYLRRRDPREIWRAPRLCRHARCLPFLFLFFFFGLDASCSIWPSWGKD